MGAPEIERKFLLPHVPDWLGNHPSERVVQGYIAITEDETEVRLRRKGSSFWLTVKMPGDLVRSELTTEITRRQFDVLWPAAVGGRLAKTRYSVPLEDNRTAEVDVYGGDLADLVTVEVEFPSREAALGFQPPAWFGREVTLDRAYRNATLARHGLPSSRSRDVPSHPGSSPPEP